MTTPVLGQIGVLGNLQWPNQPDLTERHPELRSWWVRRYIYLEMSLDGTFARPINDTIQLLSAGSWPIIAANTPKGNDAAEFVRSCFEDMRTPWRDVLADILTALGWGWSVMEIVWKARHGVTGTPRSRHEDGAWGIAALEPRRQESMYGWLLRDDGSYDFDQFAITQAKMTPIPAEKIIHFTLFSGSSGAEGVGFYRTAYIKWRDVTRLDELLRIGAFRNLAGIPIFRAPAEAVAADPGSALGQAYSAFKSSAATYVRNERTSFVLPEKEAGWDVELLQGGSNDSSKYVMDHRNQLWREMMIIIGAQYLALAQGSSGGGRALSEDQTELAESVLLGIGERICEAINNQLISRICDVNGIAPEDYPCMTFVPSRKVDMSRLATLLKVATDSGLYTPQDGDEAVIRDIMGLPAPIGGDNGA